MLHSSDPAKSRALIGLRFKIMCADAGLSIDDAANFLHVTPRTVRYWFAGKTFVPFSAYKLLRIHCRYELPGTAWAGWHMHSGKLWTPEGHGFVPSDSSWWGLLVRKARLFGQLYARHNALHQALNPGLPTQDSKSGGLPSFTPMQKAGGPSGSHEGGPGTGGTQGGRQAAPTGEAGGSGAAAPPNLLLDHFRTEQVRFDENRPAVIGQTQNPSGGLVKPQIPHHEKRGVSS